MTSKMYWWLLTLFMANGWWCCSGCWKEERIALLQLKANINFTGDSYMTSWVANETSDCCQWRGIVCSNTTRLVTQLSIAVKKIRESDNFINTDDILKNWLFNASLFMPFKNLKALLLPGHSLAGWAKNEGFDKMRLLKKLERLDLSGNYFNRSIFQSLSQLSSLKSLNLAWNSIGSGSERLSGLDKLEVLDLSNNDLNGENVFAVLELNTSRMALKKLDIRNIQSFVPNEELGALRNIEYLLLDGNTLDENFLRSSGVMSSLKVLSVAQCNLNGTLPLQGLCDLKYLEELSLRGNNLMGKLPTCLGNLTFLRVIDLSQNSFTGNIATSPLSSLLSLEYLLLANNIFEIPVSFESFANHSKLKFVIADYNSVTVQTSSKNWIPRFQLEALSLNNCSQIPSFLHYQHHLRLLRLSQCNIGGNFPNWLLENNSRLGEVYLGGNAFTGSLQLPFLPCLEAFDISYNRIQGQLSPNIGSIFPNLVISTMSNNMIGGLLPSSFGDMKHLEHLDLSSNKLTGDLPIGLAREGSKLSLLRLSNNMLKGEIFPVSASINNFRYLYLDGNNFSGPIPEMLSSAPILSSLDLSYNNLSGNLPAWLGNMSFLTSLALSRNHLNGHIPPDYCRLEGLDMLDLSENNLVGVIPSCFSALQYLGRVYLSKNKLQGEFNMFSKSELEVLDLGDNNFSGSIPKWLGNTFRINTLLLKGNRLQGAIPPQLCHASCLRILDLSYNNLSGPIPHCLGNIMHQDPYLIAWTTAGDSPYVYESTDYTLNTFGGDALIDISTDLSTSFLDSYAWDRAEFTTKYNTYSYEGRNFMTGIDLSCNKLSGEIPNDLSNLTKIQALNLSHNHLTGAIPSEFSNLQHIESLDLSYNSLTGRIPTQLVELTNLEVFSVAHNNLTGMVPQLTAQFATFNESSYEGNPLLCGPPLHINCMETKEILILPPLPNSCEDDDGFLDLELFYISFLVAYANVVLAVAVVLWVNPHWRNVWFYYVECFMYSCYDYFAFKCRPNVLRSL